MIDKNDYRAWDGLLLNMADRWSYKYGLDKGECYSELLLAYGLALDSYDPACGVPFGNHFYHYRQNALRNLIEQNIGICNNEFSIDGLENKEDVEPNTNIEDAIALVLFEMDLANMDKELVKVLDYIRDNGIIQNAERKGRVGKKTLRKSLMADFGWSEYKARTLVESLGTAYQEYCIA